MLRVGLTGSLGSGKSTVAAMLRSHGAEVIEADALGRELMEPGHDVFDKILGKFGPKVLSEDGRLNRARLAELAFREGRLNDLNSIVHPAVIDLQRRLMNDVFARSPRAVAVIESALIFEVVRDARARGETNTLYSDWRQRIDRVIVVTAPDDVKIARFVDRLNLPPEKRAAAENDARSRLAHQIPDAEKASQADYVIDNSGDLASLERQVTQLWPRLAAESNNSPLSLSLK
ncbi:MAG TPA: dephospho-CoA kinase [Terracidiphilus sp.]|nr:dephospho-CoA kinase [Terracidiphilus sp.]